ncbi:hypothetical protein MBH78_15540 [Oceanimonas sp. NS1]|nr:hypothetical protein [Oceanimonas sp. NS1]
MTRALRMLENRPELKLAVNLTRQSCHQDGFWRKLAQVLERYEAVRDRLFLELPESAFAFGWERLIAPLASLKAAWGGPLRSSLRPVGAPGAVSAALCQAGSRLYQPGAAARL